MRGKDLPFNKKETDKKKCAQQKKNTHERTIIAWHSFAIKLSFVCKLNRFKVVIKICAKQPNRAYACQNTHTHNAHSTVSLNYSFNQYAMDDTVVDANAIVSIK